MLLGPLIVIVGAVQPPVPAATTAPQPADAGLVLARMVYPVSLNAAIDDYTFRAVVTPTYRADPGLKQLEADHPGIIDAIVAAMRPAFEQGRRDALPALWAATAAIYANGLTADELRAAIAFYDGPVGRRLERLMEAAVRHAAPPANGTVIGLASPGPADDDRAAKRRFDATPAGLAFAALQPRIEQATDRWNAAPTPAADTRTNAAIAAVIARFTGSSGELR